MTKLYTSALVLAILAGSASAQDGRSAFPANGAAIKTHTARDLVYGWQQTRPTTPQADRGVAFYTEDFSGGSIPAGWTNVDEVTPISDVPVLFEWSNDPGVVRPFALNYAPSDTFNNPGATNGFLWANSDRGLPTAPATPHLTKLTTTAIDCSGQPSVQLSFNSLIGVFNYDADTAVKVRVSTDLFTWTEFAPFPCLQTGGAAPPCVRWSANPQQVQINITSVAANQPNVYIQFQWRGDWEYFWCIDDVQLTPLPAFEIQLTYGYNSQTGNGEEYGRVPVSQMPASMNMGAEVYNYGGSEQTNVVVGIAVTNGAGTDFGVSSPVGSIASGESVVVDEDLILPSPLPVGMYSSTFTVSSDDIANDDDPANNIAYRDFEVTNFIYSLDGLGNHGQVPQVVSQTGTGSFADNTEDVKLLTYYPILSTTMVYGLEIELGSATEVGSEIIASILDTVDVLATPSVVNQTLAISDTYTVTAADTIAGVVTIPFNDPVSLTPNGYYAVASLFQVNEKDVYIKDDTTVPQPGLASALWIPFDPDQNQNFYGGNGTAWAVRMSLNPSIGLQELTELSGVTMYPNPTKGILRINSEKSEKLTIEVINMLGEQMMTTTFSGNTTLDLSGYAAGVYNVRVSNGTSSTVQRITLN